MKDFAFPQHFISTVLRPAAQPTATASPFVLSPKLLGELAVLFERESFQATSRHERTRLYSISRELDRMWRVKTASIRGSQR